MTGSKKNGYTGWKDERGAKLYDGDIVHVKRIGRVCKAVVRYNNEFGRWMMFVLEDGGHGCGAVEQYITLRGARLTKRVRDVRKVGGL